MKLRIPTRRPPPDGEEEHAEQRPVAAQVEVEAQRLVRLEPEQERRVAAVEVVRLQLREVVYLLRPLTPVPRSFLQCDSKSTEARSVKSKPS